MSKTYTEIKKQIEELQVLAAAAREAEIESAKAKVNVIMKEYGLSLSDLNDLNKARVTAKSREPVAVKYKDPATGSTWTGRGRAPLWLAGKNKDDYLVS